MPLTVSCNTYPMRQGQNVLSMVEQFNKLHGLSFVSVGHESAESERRRAFASSVEQLRPIVRVVPHLTCVGLDRHIAFDMLNGYKRDGIQDIFVIRGNAACYSRGSDDFTYASDLVEYIRKEFGDYFTIGVACHPEGHPQEQSYRSGWEYFKRKVDCGASYAITQAIFDPDAYILFRDDCASKGVDIPIIPSILPLRSLAGLRNFAARYRVHVPERIGRALDGFANDRFGDRLAAVAGTDITVQLCKRLMLDNVPGLHFLTMNNPEPTQEVLKTIFPRT